MTRQNPNALKERVNTQLKNAQPPKDMQTDVEDHSSVGYLKREFSEHPSSGLTPTKLASILVEAEQGNLIAQSSLAEDLEEKDAHIFCELQKRKLALTSVPWSIEPAPNASAKEIRDAEMIQSMLEQLDIEDMIIDAADAINKGWSAQEIEWDMYGKERYIKQLHFRQAEWFQTHPVDRNQIRLRDNSENGQALNPYGWLLHEHKSKSGYIARRGLCRILAWPFIFKNYSVRDLAEFLEIYGLPLRLGKYPSGASTSEKSTLLQAVMSIGHNAGGIIPKGMELEIMSAADGKPDPFMAMIEWGEKSISKVILGGTLTSQADGKTSTNALGSVHNDGRIELRDNDLKQIARTLTQQIVQPLWLFNGSNIDPRRAPKFEFDTSEPEDIKLYAESLPALVSLGMKIPMDWAHDKLQIPQASDSEAILEVGASSPIEGKLPENEKIGTKNENALDKPSEDDEKGTKVEDDKNGTKKEKQEKLDKKAALTAQTADSNVTQTRIKLDDRVSELVDQLQINTQATMSDWMMVLGEVVQNAASLPELQQQLSAITEQLDDSELVNQLQQAIAVANLSGRLDVENEGKAVDGQRGESDE